MINEQKLEELCCLAEIGRMSCGLFHDILNPMTSLMLYLDILKDNKEFADQIQPAIDSSNSLRDLVKIIQKDFNGSNPTEDVDLNCVIDNTLKIVNHRLRQNHITVMFLKTKIPKIHGSAVKVYQVIINIISNAIDAIESDMSEENRITISTEKVNDNIVINVHDTGVGMSDDIQSKIFDRDFTTKTNGIGIGLSHTRDIIENDLGGSIKYKSTTGCGTLCSVIVSTSYPKKNPNVTPKINNSSN